MTLPSPLDSVRAQYEALPYPARDPRDEAIRLITGTPSHVLEINHYLFSGRLNFIRPFRALVAGGADVALCDGELGRVGRRSSSANPWPLYLLFGRSLHLALPPSVSG